MFTGLVECMGTVRKISPEGAGTRLEIESPLVAVDLPLGASVAVNGCCLTVVDRHGDVFAFQAGPETLRLTNLGEFEPGHRVNLERSLQLGDRLGGHIVQGHVDGLGYLASREKEGEWEMLTFRCDSYLARQMIHKGSITVDGVSLTLIEPTTAGFRVALIPHTLDVTTLGTKPTGGSVNLEIDMFAKYVFKCLEVMNLSTSRDR